MEEIRFVAASGGLGGGKVDPDALQAAMALSPHFIASDAGSTDSGPFSLGSGRPNYPREAVKRDLEKVLPVAKRAGIPVLIGSAGTAGTNSQVDWVVDIAAEIAAEHQISLRTGVIYSEQDPGYLKGLLRQGRTRPLNPAPELTEKTIDDSRIVGMMGVEPLQAAIGDGADLVIAGRCSDSALYAAVPISRGMPEGYSWHAGKVVECGTLVCETAGRGVVFGAIRPDGFMVRPFGKGLRCTPQSVAAHTLYENGHPYHHPEASGMMDLTDATFEAVDDTSVKVTGSRFVRASEYSVKLEGAQSVGFQTIMIGGIRDPFIIRQLDNWLHEVRERIEQSVSDILGISMSRGEYNLVFHVYGRNAVMGALEPLKHATPHEVGLLVEATAPTQTIATKVVELCRQPLLHHPIPEWKGAITGFACRHNPPAIERGAVYRFSLNHVALPHSPSDMHKVNMMSI